MTETTAADPKSSKKKSPRPGMARLFASYYADFLFAAFLSWVICFSLNFQAYWIWVTLCVWILETAYCRDRLIPTAGEYVLGIRYMTSSSSHVVADIQVLHPKLILNAVLVFGGVVDLTLSLGFLCGWTFLGRAVVGGVALDPPWSLIYWLAAGLLFFMSGTSMLGGNRNAVWLVPMVHAWFSIDFHRSFLAWMEMLHHDLIFTPWVSVALISAAKTQPTLILGVFYIYSLFLLVAVLTFCRKHLVN
jgi:hypothetical protein